MGCDLSQKCFKVSKSNHNQRLQSFLSDSLQISGKKVKKGIDEGACLVNGKIERFSSYKICEGDKILVDLARFEKIENSSSKNPKNARCVVLYEDNHLICIDKKEGIASEKLPFGHLVHRLDKGTSGVMLFAKTEKMKRQLENLFRQRAIKKKYIAVLHGTFLKPLSITTNVKRIAAYDGGSIWGSVKKGGKEAITHITPIASKKLKGTDVTVVDVSIETGRTHQIRVHTSELGYPIVGDIQYGKKHASLSHRMLLHAKELIFTHPDTQKEMVLKAPLPSEFNLK